MLFLAQLYLRLNYYFVNILVHIVCQFLLEFYDILANYHYFYSLLLLYAFL